MGYESGNLSLFLVGTVLDDLGQHVLAKAMSTPTESINFI